MLLAVQIVLFLAGAWVATVAGGFVVGRLTARYRQQLEGVLAKQNISTLERGFADGGKVIGWLERLLIYLFVMSGHPAGVGFLVAAKSIFRFGELKEHHNRLEAEYITIGTLMSFAWGLGVAMGVGWLMTRPEIWEAIPR